MPFPPSFITHPVFTRFRLEWCILVAVQLIATAAMTFSGLRQHQALLQAEGDRLQRRASIIDDNLSQQLDGADKALLRMADAVAGLNPTDDPEPISAQLKLLSDAMPGFRSMLWLGPDGTVRAASDDSLVGKNFAAREYFAAPLRVGDPVRLYVSPPFVSSLGNHVIVVSRMLIDSQGAFAGVLTATLDPAYFGVLLRSVLSAPDMRAALVHGDGGMFLDLPGRIERPAAQPAELPAILAAHRQRPDGRVVDIDGTPLGGALRLVSLRSLDRNEPLHDQKLVAMVSRELPAVLAPWRQQALLDAGLLAFLVILSSGSLWLDQRRRRQASAVSAAMNQDRQLAADRVDQALKGADLGLWERHVPTDTVLLNDRERALLGYAPEDALPQGPAWRGLIHPDDRAQVDAAILPHVNGLASAYECEHRMRHRAGHYIWLYSRAMIVERGPEGEPIRIVGTHLDITGRKAAEATQQITERRLRAINDHVTATVAHLDGRERYLTANEEFRRVLGLDPAAMVGRSLREMRGDAVYAQMAPHVVAVLAGDTRRFELTDVIGGVCRHFQHSLVPDIDGAGEVQGFYSVSFDITELRRSEQLLLESSARHRAIVEEQSELVSLAHEDGELVYVNPAHEKQFGRLAAELVGRSLFDLVVPADRALAHQVIAAVFATGTPRSGDSRVYAADGSERWVAWTNSLQRDAQGGVLLRSVGRDITPQRLAERALRASRKFLLQTGRVAGVGGWEVDLVGGLLTWSEQVRRIHEVDDDYVPTVEASVDFYAPEARPLITAAVQRGVATGESWDLELPMVTANGRHVWVRLVGDVEFDRGRATRLVGALQDITTRKLAEQALEELARVDTLTGLPNRRQFDERLEQALARSRRSGQQVAVMYLDIDHFKAINDTRGHAGGDAVLKEFGSRLRAAVRESDLAARLAGDEFVVLLEGLTIEDDASGVAQKILDVMRLDFEVDGSPLAVTTSLGMGFSSDASATAADLLDCADRALYEAKRAGRDRFRFANFFAKPRAAVDVS